MEISVQALWCPEITALRGPIEGCGSTAYLLKTNRVRRVFLPSDLSVWENIYLTHTQQPTGAPGWGQTHLLVDPLPAASRVPREGAGQGTSSSDTGSAPIWGLVWLEFSSSADMEGTWRLSSSWGPTRWQTFQYRSCKFSTCWFCLFSHHCTELHQHQDSYSRKKIKKNGTVWFHSGLHIFSKIAV